MKEISVTELKARMDRGDDLQLIDIRETNEYDFCNIGGELFQKTRTLSFTAKRAADQHQ